MRPHQPHKPHRSPGPGYVSWQTSGPPAGGAWWVQRNVQAKRRLDQHMAPPQRSSSTGYRPPASTPSLASLDPGLARPLQLTAPSPTTAAKVVTNTGRRLEIDVTLAGVLSEIDFESERRHLVWRNVLMVNGQAVVTTWGADTSFTFQLDDGGRWVKARLSFRRTSKRMKSIKLRVAGRRLL